MVKALIDTCVISEIRHPNSNPLVVEWVEQTDFDQTFISVITLGEIAKGLPLLPSGARRDKLWVWFSEFESLYANNVLDIDRAIALLWGELEARLKAQGFTLATTDGLIAATAIHHGLHVITRNVKHFEPTGALIINPWEE